MNRKRFNSIAKLCLAMLCIVVTANQAVAGKCEDAAGLAKKASAKLKSDPRFAEEMFLKAVDLCPKSPALRFNLAMAYHNQGRDDTAARTLDESVKINPDDPVTLNALAYLLITTGGERDAERALELANRAVDAEPGNADFIDTLRMAKDRIFDVDTPPVTGHKNPDAVAVVIGNSQYSNEATPPVEFAENDARVMKDYLVRSLGFPEDRILYKANASLVDMMKIFGTEKDHKGQLYNRVTGQSDVFVYYSGHGVPDPNTGRPYIVPRDGEPASAAMTCYPLDTLYKNLEALKADLKPKSIVLAFDACYSGAASGSAKGESLFGSSVNALVVKPKNPVMALQNAVVFASSQGDQVSGPYPEKRHNIFTYYFLRTVKDAVESGKGLLAVDLEAALKDYRTVNATSRRKHNREQVPNVTGDKSIMIVPAGVPVPKKGGFER